MGSLAAGSRVLASAVPARRDALADAARQLALWFFGALIIVSPFRLRLVLDARAPGNIYTDYADFLLFAGDVLLAGVLLLWLASLALQPRRVWFGPPLVLWPVAGLLVASLASVPGSVDVSLAGYNAGRTLFAALLGLYVINEVSSLRQLAPAIALMVLIQAVVGIAQVIDQQSLGLGDLGEKTLGAEIPGSSIVATADEPRLLRAYGLSDHPNILGGVLACAMLLLAAALSRTRSAWTSLLTVTFAVGAAVLVLTFSRAAILALGCGGVLALALLALRRLWQQLGLWLAACLAAGFLGLAFVVPYAGYWQARIDPASQPAGSTEERSLDERSALARNTRDIFLDHPVLGVGAGTMPIAMWQAYPDFAYNFQPAHIVLLDVAAEAGVLGALSYGLLMLTPWALLAAARRQLTPELIGASGALLALTVLGLFDYYTWLFTTGRIWFWLVLALWLVAYRRRREAPIDA